MTERWLKSKTDSKEKSVKQLRDIKSRDTETQVQETLENKRETEGGEVKKTEKLAIRSGETLGMKREARNI